MECSWAELGSEPQVEGGRVSPPNSATVSSTTPRVWIGHQLSFVSLDFAAKKKLNEIAKEAKEAGGASDAASLGTARHEVTEAHDARRDITQFAGAWRPPRDDQADVMRHRRE